MIHFLAWQQLSMVASFRETGKPAQNLHKLWGSSTFGQPKQRSLRLRFLFSRHNVTMRSAPLSFADCNSRALGE